jgi:TolB-like protein
MKHRGVTIVTFIRQRVTTGTQGTDFFEDVKRFFRVIGVLAFNASFSNIPTTVSPNAPRALHRPPHDPLSTIAHSCMKGMTMYSVVCRLIVSSLFLLPVSLVSQQRPTQPKKPTVAVLDFDARGGISKEEAASLSDAFQTELFSTNGFVIVDRNRIKAILTEQGFQQSEACTQVECIVDVGRILKVEKMFAGNIGKVGRIYNVNVQLIDVTTAQIISQKNRKHDGALEDLLTEIIPEIADEMAGEILGKRIVSQPGSGGSTWYWYVGGALVAGGVAAAVLMKSGSEESVPPPASKTLPAGPDLPQ